MPIPSGQARATALGEHLEHIETALDGKQIEFTNLTGLGALVSIPAIAWKTSGSRSTPGWRR